MQDILSDTLMIVAACLVIAAVTILLAIFRPSARRRRRHRRHPRRPKIDLFAATNSGPPPKADA